MEDPRTFRVQKCVYRHMRQFDITWTNYQARLYSPQAYYYTFVNLYSANQLLIIRYGIYKCLNFASYEHHPLRI